jgi:hypothetical protein
MDMDSDRSNNGAATPEPEFDRRRGPRRGAAQGDDVPVERRQTDRRKKKPGLSGLMGAILGVDETAAEPEAEEK